MSNILYVDVYIQIMPSIETAIFIDAADSSHSKILAIS
jgi:hypothetical protein